MMKQDNKMIKAKYKTCKRISRKKRRKDHEIYGDLAKIMVTKMKVSADGDRNHSPMSAVGSDQVSEVSQSLEAKIDVVRKRRHERKAIRNIRKAMMELEETSVLTFAPAMFVF